MEDTQMRGAGGVIFSLLLPPGDATEQATRSTEGYLCRRPHACKLTNALFEIK